MKKRIPAATAAVLAAAAFGAVTAGSPATAAGPTTELIVGLRAASATVQGADVRSVSADLRALTVAVPKSQEAARISALRSDPNVAYVEPNAVARAFAVTPNDPFYGQQWGLARTRVPAAWNVSTGKNVVIAVVDTGVNPVGELSGRVLPGYDFVNKDADAADDQGHGTMAATVAAAAGNNASAIAGVCWQCKILPVKVMSPDGTGSATGTYDNIAAGITWATDHGANIINLSLGSPSDSQLLRDAVAYATDHNVLVVAAAGNSGTATRNYPAAVDQAIAVAGSTSNDARYSWSNYNSAGDPWVDLAAPGSNAAQNNKGATAWFEGTSSSAPMVAGIAALAMSAAPDATAAQVRSALEGTADDVGTWVAKGRVDAEGTVQALTTDPNNPVDDPGPTTGVVVSDISVTPAAPARGMITVAPTVTSENTIRSVRMSVVAPNGRTLSVSSGKAPWTMTWNSAGMNGDATVTITATDTAGNTGSASTTVTVDNTAPSAVTNFPAYAAGVTPIALATPSDDTARVDLYVKSQLVGSATSAPWSVDLDTAAWKGAIAVKVVVTDAAGNAASSSKTIMIDNAGPRLTWNAPLISARTVLHGTVTVNASAGDPAGVTQVELLDGDGNVLGTDDTIPYAIPFDTTGYDGQTTLTLRATDTLGLVSTVDRTVMIDNQAPSLAVSTSAGGPLHGTVTIAPDVADNIAIKSVKAVLTLPNGRVVNLAAASAPWSMKWASAGANGDVTATITATDTAGNVSTATDTLTVDNTAPSAAVTLPTAVTGVVPIALTTPSDDTASMELLIRGKPVALTTSAPWSLDWDTTGLTGAVPVTLKVTDAAGNVALVNRSVTIDTTGPRITVTSSNRVTGVATVKLSLIDPAGVASVELLRDGQSIASSTAAPFALTVDTSAYDKGSQTWTLRATDNLGNVSTVEKVFSIY